MLELESGGGLVVSVEGMTGGCVGTGSRGWVGGPSGGDDRRVCWNWKQGVGWWSQWRG